MVVCAGGRWRYRGVSPGSILRDATNARATAVAQKGATHVSAVRERRLLRLCRRRKASSRWLRFSVVGAAAPVGGVDDAADILPGTAPAAAAGRRAAVVGWILLVVPGGGRSP
jgi:hypothetical protein